MSDNKEIKVVLTLNDMMSKSLARTKTHLTSFERSASSLGTKLVGAFSVVAITRFAQESVRLAGQQQMAEEKLASSIANVAGAREGDFEALLAQASALQQVTAIGDEEIINNQALLATFQLNGDAIQQLIPRILDMGAANAKTGIVTEDLKSATLAVGKAFTSGIGMLSRYGVAMTDAQKEAFRLADETGKLSILTEVLDDNFKGTAETVGKTFAGRVARLKNNLGDLREQIGFALMPTLEMFTDSMIGSTEEMKANQGAMSGMAEWIFRLVNFLKALWKSVKLIITVLASTGLAFYDLGKIIVSFIKDTGKMFWNWKENLGKIFKAVWEALKGNFEGASAMLENMFKESFDATLSNMEQMKYDMAGASDEIGDVWEEMGEAMFAAVDLNGYKPIEKASVEAYRKQKEDLDNLTKAAGEAGGKLGDTWDKYRDKVQSVNASINESMQGSLDKISDLNDKLNELAVGKAETGLEYKKDIAGAIVEQQDKVKELRKQMNNETDFAQREVLKKELEKEEEALRGKEHLAELYATQINNIRQRQSLTDFERKIKDLADDLMIKNKEYQQDIEAVNKELTLEKDKLKKIEEFQALANKQTSVFLLENEKLTVDSINREIEKWNQLAKAIANAKKGVTTGSISAVSVESQLNTAKSELSKANENITVNITGNQLLDEDAGVKIGDQIVRALQFEGRI